MKPSPGIVPQQKQIEDLHAAEPARIAPAVVASAVVASGQSADEKAVEKTIIGKIVAALQGLKS